MTTKVFVVEIVIDTRLPLDAQVEEARGRLMGLSGIVRVKLVEEV